VTPESGRRSGRERGFVLLLVLWTLALVALIGTQVTAAGRSETQVAGNLKAAAVAEAAADAAVAEAALHLLDASEARWVAGGGVYLARLPQASVQIGITDETRRLPVNTAPRALLAAVVRLAGTDPHTAEVVASQIADWRSPAPQPLKLGAKAPQYRAAGRMFGPPNRNIRSLSELRLVLGMTPGLFARLAPHLSAYGESVPSMAMADPVVRAALAEVAAEGLQPLAFQTASVFRVLAVANSVGGGHFVRRAVIRLASAGGSSAGGSSAGGSSAGGSSAGGSSRAFEVLAWSSGDDGELD